MLSQFLTFSPQAPAYYEGLTARQLNMIYGRDATARTVDDAHAFRAFSSQYIARLLEVRARTRTQSVSPLSLTGRQDLLELELPEPADQLCLPSTCWRQFKTDSPLEGIICEIRRRTRLIGAFPDGRSALMLVAAR